MIRSLLVFSILFYSSTIAALLPPFYESAKEISAILADSRVAEQITSGRIIESIVKTKTGYIITAGKCTLSVSIHYLPLPHGMVGPAEFKIEPGVLKCGG